MDPKALAALLLVACGSARTPLPHEATPGVVFPHHIAEGRGGGAPPASLPPPRPLPSGSSAATPTASASPAPAQRLSPPDPEPLRMPKQYEVRLAYEDGRITVDAVRALTFRQPVVTARTMGRFALELWIGRELIDRVRFDFPLLAVEEPKAPKRKPLHEPPAFRGKLVVTVLVPASPRVRRAVVLDRATGRETELTWPPTVTAPPTASATPPATPTPSSAAPSAAPNEPARPR
jgi:hypothetical protein